MGLEMLGSNYLIKPESSLHIINVGNGFKDFVTASKDELSRRIWMCNSSSRLPTTGIEEEERRLMGCYAVWLLVRSVSSRLLSLNGLTI
jgi:hypothetical protein